MNHKRTSKGFAVLGHILRGRARAMKRNPHGLIEISIEEAESLIHSYKSLKDDYLEALRILKQNNTKHDLVDIKTMAERPVEIKKARGAKKEVKAEQKVIPANSQWAHVLKRLNEQV